LRNGLDAARKKEWGVPDVWHDDGALGDEVAVVYVVLLDAVGCAEGGRRAPADDLPEHRGEVWERVTVRERGQTVISDNGIELGLAFLLDFGIHRHGKQEGGHRGDGLWRKEIG
jgi:hypothetical protein